MTKKISDLSATSALSDADLFEVVQSGSKKATAAQVATHALSGLSAALAALSGLTVGPYVTGPAEDYWAFPGQFNFGINAAGGANTSVNTEVNDGYGSVNNLFVYRGTPSVPTALDTFDQALNDMVWIKTAGDPAYIFARAITLVAQGPGWGSVEHLFSRFGNKTGRAISDYWWSYEDCPVYQLSIAQDACGFIYEGSGVMRMIKDFDEPSEGTLFEAAVLRTAATTVAGLPSAATSGAGARGYVTDADTPVFGNTVVGSGAVGTPVVSNGAAWKVG